MTMHMPIYCKLWNNSYIVQEIIQQIISPRNLRKWRQGICSTLPCPYPFSHPGVFFYITIFQCRQLQIGKYCNRYVSLSILVDGNFATYRCPHMRFQNHSDGPARPSPSLHHCEPMPQVLEPGPVYTIGSHIKLRQCNFPDTVIFNSPYTA